MTGGVAEFFGLDAFAVGYGLALAVMVVVALTVRFLALSGLGGDGRPTPTTSELALLAGDRTRVIHAALAELRFADAIGIDPQHRLLATTAVPSDAGPVDRAVHSAAVRGVQVFDLTTDRELSAALDDVRTAVRRAGWVLTDTGRAWLRRTWWVLLGMAVIGVGRVAWVLLGGGGIDNVAALVLVAFLIVLSFRDPPATSGRGTRAIERQRRRYRYLNPSQRPAWSTYGYQAVGLSVALYGTAALWLADPEFAQSAGLYRRSSFRTVARRGGDSGGDAGDAGCGGGDGCGGGCGGCGGD